MSTTDALTTVNPKKAITIFLQMHGGDDISSFLPNNLPTHTLISKVGKLGCLSVGSRVYLNLYREINEYSDYFKSENNIKKGNTAFSRNLIPKNTMYDIKDEFNITVNEHNPTKDPNKTLLIEDYYKDYKKSSFQERILSHDKNYEWNPESNFEKYCYGIYTFETYNISPDVKQIYNELSDYRIKNPNNFWNNNLLFFDNLFKLFNAQKIINPEIALNPFLKSIILEPIRDNSIGTHVLIKDYIDADTQVNLRVGDSVTVQGKPQNGWVVTETVDGKSFWCRMDILKKKIWLNQ